MAIFELAFPMGVISFICAGHQGSGTAASGLILTGAAGAGLRQPKPILIPGGWVCQADIRRAKLCE